MLCFGLVFSSSTGLFSEIVSQIKSLKVTEEMEGGSQPAARCGGSPTGLVPGRAAPRLPEQTRADEPYGFLGTD